MVLVRPIKNMSLLSTYDEEIEREIMPSNCATGSSLKKAHCSFTPFAFIKPIYDDKNWVSDEFTSKFVGCLDDWIYNHQPLHPRIHILLKRRQIIFGMSFRVNGWRLG